MTKKYLSIFAIGLLATLTTSISPALASHSTSVIQSSSRPPAGPKAACRIEVDSAHLSTSIYERLKERSVKVDARSVCNFVQKNVDLRVQLFKTAHLGDMLVSQSETNPNSPTSSGMTVTNYETSKLCINQKLTSYYGVAIAKALINGQIQVTSKVQSAVRIPIACGT